MEIKKYITILLLILLLVSCGSRKVESEKLEGIEINNSYSTGSKIVLGTNLTFKPFDNSKPFNVGGKEYNNVIVTNENIKIVEPWKTKTIYQTKTIYKTKTVESKKNAVLWIGIVFIICGFIFLWFYLPKLKTR